MTRLPWFRTLLALIGLAPWIIGALARGKTGLVAGLVISFIGIMVLQDANRRHAAEQQRRALRELKRGP